jgi:hypothetical protein
MKVGAYERVPFLLGVVLTVLHRVADCSFFLNGKCHEWWMMAMVKWGTREQTIAYQRRLQELRELMEIYNEPSDYEAPK